jgi:glycosyltransferase involved in cell wall biosynthesis
MEQPLKVLMISSDRNILLPGSAVAARMKEYGALVGELHIVLMCDRSHTHDLEIENGELKIAESVFVYPTNSATNFLRPLDAATRGKRVVKEKGFVRGASVITAQDPFECGWAALQVKKKWRLPLEVQLHTDPFSPYFSGFQNFVRKLLASRILRSADVVRVVNARVAETAISKFVLAKDKVSVLPIYVDAASVESAPIAFDLHARYPWRFIILVAARLTPEKNLPLAFEILSRVREKYAGAGLIIAGSGPEEGKLRALAKRLHLEGAVEFAGWQRDMTSFYKTADVYLQTSYFEGHQLALVEAGLSGLPVISTPAGIASEFESGKEAYIFPPDRPDLFAQAILDLIENNERRISLKFNMKKALEARLISKEEYLRRIAENWVRASRHIS